MQRPGRRLLGVLGAAVLAVAGLALPSCGGNGEAGGPETTQDTQTETTTQTTTRTTTETETAPPPEGATTVRVRVAGGAPVGGIVRTTVDKGDRVVLVVTSDVADHVHLHGYDVVGGVAPDRRARIAFRATIAGRFVVELENRHTQIAELTVSP